MILIIIGDADISFFFLVYRQTDRQTDRTPFLTDSHTPQACIMFKVVDSYNYIDV